MNQTKTNDGLQRQVRKDGTEIEQGSHVDFPKEYFK